MKASNDDHLLLAQVLQATWGASQHSIELLRPQCSEQTHQAQRRGNACLGSALLTARHCMEVVARLGSRALTLKCVLRVPMEVQVGDVGRDVLDG